MVRLTSRIHEVIVTTQNEAGEPHSAPMGISEVNGYFLIKPFKPSTTYNNLKRHRQCTINYIDDVRIFAGALTGRRKWPTLPCRRIEGVYLEQACFYGQVLEEFTHVPFRGFNRAQNAVVEAAILVSRLGMLPEQKIREEMEYLTIAIDKTAGDRELEAWGWLMDKVKQAGIEIRHD